MNEKQWEERQSRDLLSTFLHLSRRAHAYGVRIIFILILLFYIL